MFLRQCNEGFKVHSTKFLRQCRISTITDLNVA
jgi:hypothetical protein